MFFKTKKDWLLIKNKENVGSLLWIKISEIYEIKGFFLTFLCVQCLATAVKISYTERKK